MDKYQRKIIKLANKGIKRMMIINKKIIFKVSNIYYCIYTISKHIRPLYFYYYIYMYIKYKNYISFQISLKSKIRRNNFK